MAVNPLPLVGDHPRPPPPRTGLWGPFLPRGGRPGNRPPGDEPAPHRVQGAPPGAFRIPGGWAGVALAVSSAMAISLVNIVALGPRALLWDAAAALTGPVAYGMIQTLRARAAIAARP